MTPAASAAVAGAQGAEQQRLLQAEAGGAGWRDWGPYVAERAWGSVREDYSADGNAWTSFPFDQAALRAYRWNEDGLSAWCDSRQRLCLGISLWNEHDEILKERYFGLSGPEGNHGEDAKDYWWYVDGTPTHSYQCTRYAYPLQAFPYADLRAGNAARDRTMPEYELIDTGIFAADDYAMVTSRWAKAGPSDICLGVEVHNRSDHAATVHVLPTVWFRNTWAWDEPAPERPKLWAERAAIRGSHPTLGEFRCVSSVDGGSNGGSNGSVDGGVAPPAGTVGAALTVDGPALLFCDNDTNVRKLYDADVWAERPAVRYPKDGIGEHVISGAATVNPAQTGTKAAFHHVLTLAAGESRTVRVRLTVVGDAAPAGAPTADAGPAGAAAHWARDLDGVIQGRQAEADAFWATILRGVEPGRAKVSRQAMAGLLASKQYYPYDVRRWASGDPSQPAPPAGHATSRNTGWPDLVADDVILMPDPWEYPWFAAWDLALHCMALALVDPALAKRQLLLLLGERYMHPDGGIPAYEWNFSDTNPPVHAWAALQIFYIDGSRDADFLRRVMHKLLINFTWWVNRKDAEGNNLFEGGFLGLDNIGAFDRSAPLPDGSVYEQSDATAWMAMFCLDMLRMALILARVDHTYDDLAVKFLTHFCYITAAAEDLGLWDDAEGFFYDQLRGPDGRTTPIKIRSVVGLIPLAAVTTLDEELTAAIPALAEQVAWLRAHRPDLADAVRADDGGEPRLLSMVHPDQLRALLRAAFDPAEFLSGHGLRSMSARHRDQPAWVHLADRSVSVGYEPAESRTGMFGGNSNWRGPVWFPVNVLLLSALKRFDQGGATTVEYPTGSGRSLPLREIADDLGERLMGLFLPGPDGERPCQAGLPWQEDVLFNEYFDGDTGAGLGATHQTGWTALVALLAVGKPD